MEVKHQVYIIDGLTGAEQFLKEAGKRLRREGEPTRVHYHRQVPGLPPGEACNSDCITYGEQPPIGGFCENCGHFAGRHGEEGCLFERTEEEMLENPELTPKCDCKVMRWQTVEWPRPWLSAPDGLHT